MALTYCTSPDISSLSMVLSKEIQLPALAIQCVICCTSPCCEHIFLRAAGAWACKREERRAPAEHFKLEFHFCSHRAFVLTFYSICYLNVSGSSLGIKQILKALFMFTSLNWPVVVYSKYVLSTYVALVYFVCAYMQFVYGADSGHLVTSTGQKAFMYCSAMLSVLIQSY